MKRIQITLLAAALAVLLSAHAGLAQDKVSITSSDGKFIVKIADAPFTEYVFEGHAKPIFYPVVGPHGIEMTRNFPMKKDVANEARDHPHHKSIWFTHGDVNGIDFWLEYPEPEGRTVQREAKVQGASILTKDDWVAPDGKIVCTDSRNISFGTTPHGRYIDFEITIHASHGDVTFGDTKEGTMGMRTNSMMRLRADPKRGNEKVAGKSVNSEGVEGKEMWGKRAKWVDYWAPIDNHTVGIAIFDHPKNPRHPSWWHARDYGLVAANPFGIHDFEKKEAGVGDMKIASGESRTFRYRFLFHSGDVKKADIAGEYSAFAK
jgi:methane monooxygenase PmoA-like